jgi:rRNA-processing protein EBP2
VTNHHLQPERADGSSGELGVTEAEDMFDVAVDNELAGYTKPGSSGGKKRPGAPRGAPSAKRQRKDAKYGFGGKKRHAKSGDAISSGDLTGFSTRRMKGKPGPGGGGGGGGKAKRPGKARRQAFAAKR